MAVSESARGRINSVERSGRYNSDHVVLANFGRAKGGLTNVRGLSGIYPRATEKSMIELMKRENWGDSRG
jgi:hypothetical protein